MDYVEWVDRVIMATVRAWEYASGHQQLMGVEVSSILVHLNVQAEENPLRDPNSALGEGIRDALNDLDRMGLIEFEYNRQFKLTQEGSKLLKAALSNSWPQIMDVYITDEQHSFLSKLVELSEDRSSDSVRMTEIEGQHVHECLGLTWDHDGSSQTHLVMQRLEDVGMIRGIFTAGSSKIWPTYVGAVKVTRELESSLGQKIRDLIEDWETTNVEFKRELNLNGNSHKALLTRELLGLVTTKSSGARYLVIGFDDDTHEFSTPVDPAMTQDRIEDILNAYCVQAVGDSWQRPNAQSMPKLNDPTVLSGRCSNRINTLSVVCRHHPWKLYLH